MSDKKDSSVNTTARDSDSVTETVSALNRDSWMKSIHVPVPQRQLSDNERASLAALIAYLAHQLGETEFRIERRLSDRFNVPNARCLPSDLFEDAVRYLVDAIPSAAE